MKSYQRWPIPEMLIGRQKQGNFGLKIDSLLKEAYSSEHIKEWAKYRQELKAPANSEDSEEDKPIIGSEDSEVEDLLPKVADEEAEDA